MKVGEKVVLHYENGETKTIVVPSYGEINIIIQNNKIYRVDTKETEIVKH